MSILRGPQGVPGPRGPKGDTGPAGETFPSQTGNAGKVLSTNGSTVLWVPSSTSGGGVFVDVRSYPGSDLGAKMQAANDAYGDSPALLYVSPSALASDNTFNTNVTFNANKTVWLTVGTYPVRIPDLTVLFLIHDNFTLQGDGWNTIVEQPTGMTAVAPRDESIIDGDLPGQNFWCVRDLQFITPHTTRASTGGESCIALGNSQHVYLRNIFFNGCWGIDWTLGGNANPIGSPAVINHCDDASVINCVSLYSADDKIKGAVVNARNWKVIGCSFLNGAVMDVEQNTRDDDQSTFVIADSLWRGGGGLLIQGPQARYGVVSGCTFYGEGAGTTAISSNGCINVKYTGNFIDGYNGGDTVNSIGIQVNNCNNVTLEGNTVLNCSLQSASPNPSGSPPIQVVNSVNTIVRNNHIAAPEHGWSAFHESSNCTGTVLEGNTFGLGSGSTITVTSSTDNPRFGAISSASAGLTLPQATIFSPMAGQMQNQAGTLTIVTLVGGVPTTQNVTYTGTTATSFTGCTGGTGTMYLGAEPDITLAGTGSRAWNNIVATGDGSTSIIWSKDPVNEASSFRGYRSVSGTGKTATTADAIIGVDTTTLACDITLPNPATAITSLSSPSVSTSWTLRVQDESNNAATHNITIKRFGTEKINGVAADYVISTNSKGVTVYTNGTNWFIS